MKAILTIEAGVGVLAKVLAALEGTSAIVTAAPTISQPTMTTTATTDNDDDEATDADAVPGQIDANGLPWDERIHSTPAKLTSKNVWRAKRGVNSTLVAQVEAELRARGISQPQANMQVPGGMIQQQPQQPVMQQPQQMQAPQGYAPQPQANMQVPGGMIQQQPQQMQAPQGYAPPVMQQQPQPQANMQVPQVDFAGFMNGVQKSMAATGTDANYFASLSQRVGQAFNAQLNSIGDFGQDQNLINKAVELMVQDGRWVY